MDCGGFTVGLIEWVLLWVCGFFYNGLQWIYNGLRCGFAFAVVSAFFLFFILRFTKHCKIFSGLFS